jgi:hypothetical protein
VSVERSVPQHFPCIEQVVYHIYSLEAAQDAGVFLEDTLEEGHSQFVLSHKNNKPCAVERICLVPFEACSGFSGLV